MALLGRTPSDKSECENPDLARCSAEVVDEAANSHLRVMKKRTKQASKRSCRCENDESISPSSTLEALGVGENGPGTDGLANAKGSRMKGGVCLGTARVLLQERETASGGVRMTGVVWVTESTTPILVVLYSI